MNLTTIKFLLYKHHLTTLFTILLENHLPFLVLKGWSFIPDLYPDPATRPFSDIDILIRPADYPAVTSVLTDLGYSVRAHVRAGSKPAHPSSIPLVRAGFVPAPSRSQPTPPHIPLEITFSHPAGIHIDLHTHILTLAWWQPTFPIDLDHIWRTAQPYPDSTGLQLHRLSPEVTFLHLCLHLFNHGILNSRFHSYIDLVLLLRKYSHTMHWDHILHLAQTWGMQNILFWVSQILHRDYHITLPIQILPPQNPIVRAGLVPAPEPVPGADIVSAPPPWLSSFLLRLSLIDRPSLLPKLLLNAIFPNASLRTAIHNQPRTLLQHWKTYTYRLLKSLHSTLRSTL